MWVAAGLLATVAVSALLGRSNSAELVSWRTDPSAAFVQAKAQHKQVLLDFSAEWCGPCQEMKHTTWTDSAAAAAASGEMIPVRVDVDQHPDWASRYHADQIPMLVLADADGTPIKSSVGYLDGDDFVRWLKGPAVP